jgi:hypothetical protein
MSSRASIPAAELRSALAKGGWRVESVEEGEARWCRVSWRLRSTWSPQTTQAYLSFLVDPQDRSRMPKIWAVRASATPPVQRMDAEGEHTLSFSKNWRRELPHLVRYLGALRGGVRSNSALLTDASTSPLRTQRGAAKRGR